MALGGPEPCQIFRKLLACYFEYINMIDRHCSSTKNVNHQKTTRIAHFEAPGMLKTAPACIVHHI